MLLVNTVSLSQVAFESMIRLVYYVKHEVQGCLTRLLRVYLGPHASMEEATF